MHSVLGFPVGGAGGVEGGIIYGAAAAEGRVGIWGLELGV